MPTKIKEEKTPSPLEPTRVFLWYIFVTAMEGGINYWAQKRQYHHSFGDQEDYENFYANIIDVENDNTPHTINSSTILLGLDRVLTGETILAPSMRRIIFLAKVELDASNIDADIADIIVQLGLFGEVIYG